MLILASASPRRQELLKLITEEFLTVPADIEERVGQDVALYDIPQALAGQKAAFVSRQHPDDLVIGCDTGVFTDGQMLGKPQDCRAAADMLRMLSGKTHRVITGCAVYRGGACLSAFSQATEVTFYSLSDAEIEDYIATGEPMDKAGAYGIQGRGSLLVREIKGDYFNVVGLPVAALYRALKAIYTKLK